jgi:glycosyltransferase involved in cell wall biosynthesis
MFACSEAAKHWFYSEELIQSGNVQILANAVDAERFRFRPEKRAQIRRELGVENNLVIACIARFRPEKNQIFLMDVLKEILKQRQDVTFLFAGDGPCEDEVKAKAKEYGIDGHTLFLGMRTDVPDLLQAADAFVLPSLWEGLPVTAIEAQASGLHCVVSEGLTEEMNALGMVEYLSLKASPAAWGEALLNAATKPRHDTYQETISSGFDINTTAPWLQNFYLQKHYGK